MEQDLGDQLAYQRGIQAVIWGMPAVNVATLREATFRDLGARYNDIVYMSDVTVPRHELLTATNHAPYVMVMLNLRQGPVVLEVPEASPELFFCGSAVDSWMVPIVDIRAMGADAGTGCKYLFLPPGYSLPVAREYVPAPSKTTRVHVTLRPIARSGTLAEAVAHSKRLRAYPLSQAGASTANRYIDAYPKPWRTLPTYDMSFFETLAQVVAEEPAQEKDAAMLGMLASIGIRRGAPFMPEGRLARALELAVKDGRRQMEHYFETPGLAIAPYRPDSQWQVGKRTPKAGGSFTIESRLLIDERAGGFAYWTRYEAKNSGEETFELRALRDNSGQPLHGEHQYRLRIPPHVPARHLWSVTAYGKESKAYLHNDLDRVGLSSRERGRMLNNPDGSVDLYFGPQAPAGRQPNWIPTADRDFFLMFRLYGAQRPVLDRSFHLPDLERVH